VLIVERDPALAHRIASLLAIDGLAASLARGREQALELAASSAPVLALIGSVHPGGSAEMVRAIRSGRPGGGWDPQLGLLVFAPERSTREILDAFEAGADDVLVPPAAALEMTLRVRALMRRLALAPSRRLLLAGPVEVDTIARRANVGPTALQLRRIEFELLVHLAREPDRVFTRAELCRELWQQPPPAGSRALDGHASRLRRRLSAAGASGMPLSVRGVGYRLRG